MFNGTSRKDILPTRTRTPKVHKKKDGLLLICSDGTTVYLSWWDRFMYRLGVYSVDKLDDYHRASNVYSKHTRW